MDGCRFKQGANDSIDVIDTDTIIDAHYSQLTYT